MSFKIIKNNCCGLDVHKTWIFACIGITDSNNRTEYKQARFSSFTKGLNELCDWLAKYNCKNVCMESTGKYWIPVFNILEQHNLWITLSHPKYTKPMKGNKTDRKNAKWICDLYMCGMVKPSFIPPADIRELRDLVRYRYKLTCMITGEKNRAQNCLTVSNLKLDEVFSDVFGKSSFLLGSIFSSLRVCILCQCPKRGNLYFYETEANRVLKLIDCVNALKGTTFISNDIYFLIKGAITMWQCPEWGYLHFYPHLRSLT